MMSDASKLKFVFFSLRKNRPRNEESIHSRTTQQRNKKAKKKEEEKEEELDLAISRLPSVDDE